MLAEQTTLRGLTEAVIYDPITGQVVASAGLLGGLGVEPPPGWANMQARSGDVVVMNSPDGTRVRAVVQLEFDAAPAADDRPSGRSADPATTCSAPSRR